MAEITTADISKLRKMTGAGIMDCKKALEEADGDFDAAVENVRKRSKYAAAKRVEREASEGVAIAKVSSDETKGVMVVLNCETDFVAKNENFVNLAYSIADTALENNPADLDSLKELTMDGRKVNEHIEEHTGMIGEKMTLSYFDKIEAQRVIAYIHPGNKIASLVGFNKSDIDIQVMKDVAMQVAAMNPVSINEDDVPQEVADRELEIGKDQARQEGKPENIVEKIAQGKLKKFYKESTLLNQEFIKDSKKSVADYLKEADSELTVTEFKRYSLAG